jgi:uncharacterized membrane protein
MIKIVKKYLESTNFYNQNEAFEDFFFSHPNYPSLYAISDSLTLLSIENIAVKVPKEKLSELPESFLAFYNNDLVLVTKTNTVVIIETEKGDKKTMSNAEFIANWNGIILAIEPNTTESKGRNSFNFIGTKYGLSIVSLIVLSMLFYGFDIQYFLLLITSLMGFIVSIFIIQEKLGVANETVSKICNWASNTSCYSVIKSSQSNINKWVSFVDLPLVFFTVNLLSLLLFSGSSTLVGCVNLVSIPMILYSIWIQKFQLKKWCVLCLTISFIIIFQAIIFSINFNIDAIFEFSNLFFYLFSLIAVTSVWFFVKPILEDKIQTEKLNLGLKKFKRNYSIFNFLLKDILYLEGFNELEGIHFGNNNAEVKLTIFISPSCGHCHKAFQDSYELIKKYPERIFLNVLFNINPENKNNPYTFIVERLLDLNRAAPEKGKEAMLDWHIQQIGLQTWKEKWFIETIDLKVNHQILLQYNWCLKNELNYTPVKIVNSKLFPNEYEISELKYFLNDFSDEKVVSENSLIEQ